MAKNLNKIIFGLIAIALVLGGLGLYLPKLSPSGGSGDDFAGAAGDVDRTKRIHQVGLTAATNTPASILNPSGGRSRFITKAYCYGTGAGSDQALLNGEQSTNLSNLSIATSTSQYATTSAVQYIANGVTFQGFTASSSNAGYYSTSTPIAGQASWIWEWPAGSYLLFRVGSQVSTTSATLTGYCGAEYYLNM